MTTLAFRNQAQKVLFDEELRGQISDGFWENAGPWEHWKPWTSMDLHVIVDPDNVGRDFHARKDNYNLAAKALLDIVGERMVDAVRTLSRDADDGLLNEDYDMRQMRADLRDMKAIFRTRRS